MYQTEGPHSPPGSCPREISLAQNVDFRFQSEARWGSEGSLPEKAKLYLNWAPESALFDLKRRVFSAKPQVLKWRL